MKKVKKPSFAGSFYSANSSLLREEIDRFFDSVVSEQLDYKDLLGVISPHAGYVFSGQCSAYSFKAIQKKNFELAVVIAPSHHSNEFYYSVGDYDEYQTPLGNTTVDSNLVAELLKDAKFTFSPFAHIKEHSLEVQLPFLQVIKPEARILPILIGKQSDVSSQYLSNKLTKVLKEDLTKTVFIISSDLSHYHDSVTAREMDNIITKAVETLDSAAIIRNMMNRKTEACGFGGILTLIELAKSLGYDKAKTLHYTHSGESCGDNSHVVGYLSSLIYR